MSLKKKTFTEGHNGFNDFYYSFSPIIADYERENPVFKEAVKKYIQSLTSMQKEI